MTMRQLTLESGTWQYMVGKQHVKLRTPDGKGHTVTCNTLLGVTDWDDGGYAVKPSDVRAYVESNLLTAAK